MSPTIRQLLLIFHVAGRAGGEISNSVAMRHLKPSTCYFHRRLVDADDLSSTVMTTTRRRRRLCPEACRRDRRTPFPDHGTRGPVHTLPSAMALQEFLKTLKDANE